MSAQCEVIAQQVQGQPLGIFERYLTLWVFLCIAVGIGLGQLFPSVFEAIGRLELARVNLPVAALIWLMIVPMLLKVDFGALHEVRRHWKGIGVTLFINWGVKPFSMALLGWLFIRHAFSSWLPADQLDARPMRSLIVMVSNGSGFSCPGMPQHDSAGGLGCSVNQGREEKAST
jgi:ACR3 family arsenite transporter